MTIEIIKDESIDRLKNMVKKHISSRAPGLLELLDLYSLSTCGKEILSLLIESPCEVYKLLCKIYKDKTVASIIMMNLLILPLYSIVRLNSLQKHLSDALRECIK